MSVTSAETFNQAERLSWAQQALRDAAEAAKGADHGKVPVDLVQPDGWRWRVLDDLTNLSSAVDRDYQRAQTRQQRQAWQARLPGPLATGGSAAAGSVVSAVGAGIIKTSSALGWIVVIAGVLLAVLGSVFSATNYVRNRNQKLRFLRLLHDIWDFAYLVLPTANPADAYTQLAAVRTQWETAGN